MGKIGEGEREEGEREGERGDALVIALVMGEVGENLWGVTRTKITLS